jgi:uncharacterized membrane protein YqiK
VDLPSDQLALLIILGAALVLLLILILFGNMVVIINGQQVGIVERRYFGRPLPAGRVVAMGPEVGFQARALRPGLKLLIPFLYVVRKVDMIVVGEEEVGLVESIDGQAIEPGRIFARHVSGHDNFQDGEAFLQGGGQKLPRTTALPCPRARWSRCTFPTTTTSRTHRPSSTMAASAARSSTCSSPARTTSTR